MFMPLLYGDLRVLAIDDKFVAGSRSMLWSPKPRSCRSMEYFGASIQRRNAGHRHQTRSRANMMTETENTIRLIIVLSSPAVGYRENARIRPGRAFDLR